MQTPGAGEGAHESGLVVADSVTDTDGPGQSFRCRVLAPPSNQPSNQPLWLISLLGFTGRPPPHFPSKTSLHTQLCPHLEAI